jgi:hypothetical protein
MPVKGFELTAIEGKRRTKQGDWDSEIKIKSDCAILMATEHSKNIVEIEFRFTGTGNTIVKIEGVLLYESPKVEYIVSSEKIPSEIKHEIDSTVTNICLPEAISISRVLIHRIPPMVRKTYFRRKIGNVWFNSIEGRRFVRLDERIGPVKIEHNSSVTMITERSEKEAGIDFRFTANFTGVGIIKIEGNFVYTCDARRIVRKWYTTGNMPRDMATEVHTTILVHCIPETVVIARDLQLPPPIPLPEVKFEERKPERPTGIEVA